MEQHRPSALSSTASTVGVAMITALFLVVFLPRLTSLTGQVNTSPPVDRYPPEQAHDGVVLRSGRYSLLAGEGQGSFPVVASTFATDPSARFWGYEPTGQEEQRMQQGLPPDQIWNGRYFISAALQSGYPWYSNPQYASRVFTAMQQRHWYYVKVEDATTDLFFRTGQGVMGRAYDASCGTVDPFPMQVSPLQTIPVTLRMQNTGPAPWIAYNNSFSLGLTASPGVGLPTDSPFVSTDTMSGALARFSFSVTAPILPGSYAVQWQMHKDYRGQPSQLFGSVCQIMTFSVVASPLSSSVPAAACGDGRVAEPCDDGNTVSWDGCAPDCTVEAAFTCTRPPNVPSQPPQPSVCTPFLPDLTGVLPTGSSSSSPVQSSSSRSFSSSTPSSAQGNLYITRDIVPLRTRQLLGGQLGEPILRLNVRAENEDVDITLLTMLTGGTRNSLDHLELFRPGETSPFATASHGACGAGYGGNALCARMQSRQLVVPNGQSVTVIVRPRIKNDTDGGLSGESIDLQLVDLIGMDDILARGIASGNNLAPNDADATAEGEIFIGRDSPGPNQPIVGNNHKVVLSKIVLITNASPDANIPPPVPVGTAPIARFRISAAAHGNARNGLNKVVLTDIIFTVAGPNVQLDWSGFRFYSAAAPMTRSPCQVLDAAPGATTFAVACWDIDASGVNTQIDQGTDATFVLEGNVLNPMVSASAPSSLQVSLERFTDALVEGMAHNFNHIRWLDRDDGVSMGYFWVEYPEETVRSTLYAGAAQPSSSSRGSSSSSSSSSSSMAAGFSPTLFAPTWVQIDTTNTATIPFTVTLRNGSTGAIENIRVATGTSADSSLAPGTDPSCNISIANTFTASIVCTVARLGPGETRTVQINKVYRHPQQAGSLCGAQMATGVGVSASSPLLIFDLPASIRFYCPSVASVEMPLGANYQPFSNSLNLMATASQDPDRVEFYVNGALVGNVPYRAVSGYYTFFYDVRSLPNGSSLSVFAKAIYGSFSKTSPPVIVTINNH